MHSDQPVRIDIVNGVRRVGYRDPQAMPYVLLGNSFLAQFQMIRNNEQMVLEKRR